MTHPAPLIRILLLGGALSALSACLEPIAKLSGIPSGVLPLALLSPVSGSGFSWGTILFWLFILLFTLPFLRACMSSPNCDPRTDPNCSYSRSSSGSYGGYTSGGSHK